LILYYLKSIPKETFKKVSQKSIKKAYANGSKSYANGSKVMQMDQNIFNIYNKIASISQNNHFY